MLPKSSNEGTRARPASGGGLRFELCCDVSGGTAEDRSSWVPAWVVTDGEIHGDKGGGL